MVGLRGKETNVCLWKVIRNTKKIHRITIGIREFVYCSTNADDPINFSDIPDWNITLHIVNALRKGVKPNEAPVSQIRMSVRGSFGPPGTVRFSNVPRRAATRAMQEEMFFS